MVTSFCNSFPPSGLISKLISADLSFQRFESGNMLPAFAGNVTGDRVTSCPRHYYNISPWLGQTSCSTSVRLNSRQSTGRSSIGMAAIFVQRPLIFTRPINQAAEYYASRELRVRSLQIPAPTCSVLWDRLFSNLYNWPSQALRHLSCSGRS
ncbi:hypothetical protein Psfp_01678 [Pelotomaculum sp. FP]|nr:hypothetical protein Psfp_01678 [Pelotomaculum sp. FP]